MVGEYTSLEAEILLILALILLVLFRLSNQVLLRNQD
jgi:hypothetical protein